MLQFSHLLIHHLINLSRSLHQPIQLEFKSHIRDLAARPFFVPARIFALTPLLYVIFAGGSCGGKAEAGTLVMQQAIVKAIGVVLV